MSKQGKSILLLLLHSPYGASIARSALDAALATAVFEQDISLLFMDDAVWHLLPGQDTSATGIRNLERTLASFELYDLDSLYVDEQSLAKRQLSGQNLNLDAVAMVEAGELPAFIENFDQVWSF